MKFFLMFMCSASFLLSTALFAVEKKPVHSDNPATFTSDPEESTPSHPYQPDAWEDEDD